MKLTKADYMRLPKERLAELLAEMDDVKIEPIVIPQQPTTPPNEPWRNPYNPYPLCRGDNCPLKMSCYRYFAWFNNEDDEAPEMEPDYHDGDCYAFDSIGG